MTDFTDRKIMAVVHKELEDLKASGYIVPENADMEVAQAMQISAFNITKRVMAVIEPKQYVRIDGKFYSKAAVQQIRPIER